MLGTWHLAIALAWRSTGAMGELMQQSPAAAINAAPLPAIRGRIERPPASDLP